MTHSERYKQAVIRPEKLAEVTTVAKRMIQNKPRYEAVSLTLASGMPWWFVAIVHLWKVAVNSPVTCTTATL